MQYAFAGSCLTELRAQFRVGAISSDRRVQTRTRHSPGTAHYQILLWIFMHVWCVPCCLDFLKSFFSHASCFASFPLSCITICILLLFLLLYTMSFFLILYLSEPACTTSLFHTRPHDTCVIHKPKLSVIQTLNTLTATQLS